MNEDSELLERYARTGDEDAFGELVRRHVGLVYSVAVRQVGGDVHLAHDVAQAVFSALARKARRLSGRAVIGGWLYRATHFAASDAVRAARRRRAREQEALNMQEIESAPEPGPDMEALRPLLDEAIGELGDTDRDAVCLRFFEERSYGEIGHKLNLTENTARMRVDRALDKLHAILLSRGVVSTTAALALALPGQAALVVPAGMAAAITEGALVGGAAAGATVAGWSLVQAMTSAKTAVGVAAVVSAVAITTVVYETNEPPAPPEETPAAVAVEETASPATTAHAADPLPMLTLEGAEHAHADSTAPSGEVATDPITLPVLEVSGEFPLPKPEAWRYARIDGFEVLSNASERESNRLLKDFAQFRQALEVLQPLGARTLEPATIVLCGAQGRFTDFTADGKRDYTGVVSRMLRDRERAAIVVNLEAETVSPLDGIGRFEFRVDHYRQLYREYIRFLLSESDIPRPPWLVEGLTQVVTDIEFQDRTINLGKLDMRLDTNLARSFAMGDVNAGPTRSYRLEPGTGSNPVIMRDSGFWNQSTGYSPFHIALRNRPLMPLDEFFAVAADSTAATNPLGDSHWAKQAYAFVHMCLFRQDGKYRDAYAEFVRRIVSEPVSEALFKECFGISYKEMLGELHAYVRYPRHVFRHVVLTKEGRLGATDVEFRDATQSEIGRIKGDAQRMAGRLDDSLLALRTAYRRGEREPELIAALGVEEARAGQTERARALLETAASLGTERPSAYAALARLRLDEEVGRSAAGGKLAPAQMMAVFGPLLKARLLQPPLPDVYRVMAEAWERSATAPTPANVHLIGEGAMKFPSDTDLAWRTAGLYARAGDTDNAASVIRMSLKFAADEAIRRRFEEFLSSLPSPPPANKAGASPKSS
jgi:RNA polymerase sigma factor (sigma-70 family)